MPVRAGKEMLAITVCATKSYTYAMRAQARRVVANIRAANIAHWNGTVILVGDASKEIKSVRDCYANLLPEGWKVMLVSDPALTEGGENYKTQAQLLIATMRQEAFAAARKIGASHTWSLDSDVLPPPNALRCMLHSLAFDANADGVGYYAVATCPYPNSAFLGGFGTPRNPIAEDFLQSERIVPPELLEQKAADEAEAKALIDAKTPITDEHRKKWDETSKRIRECPPDGNIWQVTAKHGWRRRGWLDHAYPAIGRGALVPSDWCGFGCTLLNHEALTLADFDGYDGKGTEDLFVCWHRWHPAGLRLNVITHCPCDHVIWSKKKNGDETEYTHHISYHEQEGECRGHLRVRKVPWIPERV